MGQAKSLLLSLGILAAAGAGGLVIGLGDDSSVVAEYKPLPVADATVFFKGKCDDVQDAKCLSKNQLGDVCACYVEKSAEPTTGTIDSSKESSESLWRLLWCSGKVANVRCINKSKVLPTGCSVLIDNIEHQCYDLQVEDKVVEELRKICTPCDVNPGWWGNCPRCAFDTKAFPDGCAGACREK